MHGFLDARDRTTVVVLVRPQADVLQSFVNDRGSSGEVRDPDATALERMRFPVQFYSHLRDDSAGLLQDRRRPSRRAPLFCGSALGTHPHISTLSPPVFLSRPIHPNRFTQRDPRHRQMPLSLATRWAIEDFFEQTNCAFFRITGVYLSGACDL